MPIRYTLAVLALLGGAAPLTAETLREACANLGADHASEQQKKRKHDIHRFRRHGVHHRRCGGHEQDLEQRRADHHACRHAEDIKHRRDHDEPAADAEQHCQDPRRKAQDQRRERRDIKTRAVKTPA